MHAPDFEIPTIHDYKMKYIIKNRQNSWFWCGLIYFDHTRAWTIGS